MLKLARFAVKPTPGGARMAGRMLTSHDEEIRAIAAAALWGAGEAAEPAFDALVKALEDDAPRVRNHAARALSQIPSRSDESIPALQRAEKQQFSRAMNLAVHRLTDPR